MLPVFLLSLAFVQQPRPTPATAFDSTKDAISAMGRAVADVKSGLDVYRRAAFNSPSGDLLFAADYLFRACRTLEVVAKQTPQRLCPRCGDRAFQSALADYRAVMPEVSRTGARCASQLGRLTRSQDSTAAHGLRRAVRVITDEIVRGLMPYERGLAAVRVAAGWAPSPAVRGADAARPPGR